MAKDSGGASPLFFLGLIAFFVLIWFSTGGPSRPGSWAGPFLTAPTAPIASDLYNFPRAPLATGVSESPAQSERVSAQEQANAQAYGPLSPFRGHIRIEQVRLGSVVDKDARDVRRRRDPAQEHVILRATDTATNPIDITGWTIVSGKNKDHATIPTGVQTFLIGQTQQAERILISGRDRVLITTGRSPVGTSFRENMCTGYLGQYQTFVPTLTNRCPTPSKEFDAFYTGPSFDATFCRNHVATIPSCTYQAHVPRNIPSTCKPFIDQYLHHNGCVIAHQLDTGFLGDTWRVYLGQTRTLYADTYETVRLLDANGFVVDVYAY